MGNNIIRVFILSLMMFLGCQMDQNKYLKTPRDESSFLKLDSIEISCNENDQLWHVYLRNIGNIELNFLYDIYYPIESEYLHDPEFGLVSKSKSLRLYEYSILDSTKTQKIISGKNHDKCLDTMFDGRKDCIFSNSKEVNIRFLFPNKSRYHFNSNNTLNLTLVTLTDTMDFIIPFKNIKVIYQNLSMLN